MITLAGVVVTSATPDALGAFNQTYSVNGTALDSCVTCHTEDALTPYGMDVLASGLNFTSIEDSDSDSDGFTNMEEIAALTSPGDANDYPETVADAEVQETVEETTSETTSDNQSPGFGIILAIAGIVSVVYLKRQG
ncbi:PGF-CTERM sorting domain-containing protein [Methanolobus mangrovi]|uniref:PGF-CTERM sorting domain-containing protein n=1 Tax=Methanolobus mangrovi TaxID=3072977 RepID=A0AA51UE76_9EURY|nr:PGF-CTERM sorting domain-containing protein [Methanolobus mangrovi]WMW21570.1 PGF-CTERM sorting domain-containing protein [Methanolobus mangrovi]